MGREIIAGLRFGIDLGIASCGWAVIRQDDSEERGKIVAMGTWGFDASENPKDGTALNAVRRTARGMRRVLRRRRERMASLRRLFAEARLIPTAVPEALKLPGLDPWAIRAEALDQELSGPELAVALGHIAKHRGFRSNSKRERGTNAGDETSKMLTAIDQSRDRLAGRTIGQMFAEDSRYQHRKRNRDGTFEFSILRSDHEDEVRAIFLAQRRFRNGLATTDLERDFVEAAFSQRPLQDSEDRVGPCLFEPSERRAALRAPSFERFRFLSRLATLRIGPGRDPERLTADEMRLAECQFGVTKTYTYKRLREAIDLPDALHFIRVPRSHEGRDCVARSGAAAEGTTSLRKAIQEGAGDVAWGDLTGTPEKLDGVARVLTFRDDVDSIRRGLDDIGLEQTVIASLMSGVESGRFFSAFKGSGGLSSKACLKIIPGLRRGLDYTDACASVGYDHAKRRQGGVADVKNPVARKALGEAVKQVKAMIEIYGLPEYIHVELARDVGKSREERDEIERGIDKRNKAKDVLRKGFEKIYRREPRQGSDEMLRFELWKEQNGRCLYTDRSIAPHDVIASNNSAEVDHILPWSKSGDDSFVNKTLCATGTNRDKRGRTPFRWFSEAGLNWDAFTARVESVKFMKGIKKRNFLLEDENVLEGRFRERNLNDTRYACRLLLDELKSFYPVNDRKAGPDGVLRSALRVFARPGPLTDRLRRAWGLQHLKKSEAGERLFDDRHHPLDALIVAATSRGALQRFTLLIQREEEAGSDRDFRDFAVPWRGFVADATAWVRNGIHTSPHIFVARAERRRARGEAHGATIRAVEVVADQVIVYERKSIDQLVVNGKRDDLALIKDPGQNGELIAALRAWIDAGKPAKERPKRRYGGVNSHGEIKEPERFEDIRKVTLRTKRKPDVLVRGGAADRGEMTRVDVFTKPNRRGSLEYFVVPVYPHQVFDRLHWPAPPDRAVQGGKPEAEWPRMDESFTFLWSLYPMSYVAVDLGDKQHEGYFRSMDRSTGAMTLSHHSSKSLLTRSIGVRTAKGLRKFAVDRLGRRFEIERETRTWHGAACT